MHKPPRPPEPPPETNQAGISIRVVANRTGISPDTLRIWERRYGFPKPARRAGGSRTYSEDDVAKLRLVVRALEAGYRPNEVVGLSLAELSRVVAAPEQDALEPVHLPGVPGVDAMLEALIADDIDAMRKGLRAAALALGPKDFVTVIAHPLAIRVGQAWADGEIDVRHEHLASELLTTQLRLLLGAQEDGERSPLVLLATLPGETHGLALDMVAVYLAASLAAPRILGADTPVDQIAAATLALGAEIVGISVSLAADPTTTAKNAGALRTKLPRRVSLWMGGQGALSLDLDPKSFVRVATWPELDQALAEARGHKARSP